MPARDSFIKYLLHQLTFKSRGYTKVFDPQKYGREKMDKNDKVAQERLFLKDLKIIWAFKLYFRPDKTKAIEAGAKWGQKDSQ